MVTRHHLVKSYCIAYDDIGIVGRYEGDDSQGQDMPERTDWEEKAKGLIRGEMARRGVTYARLVEKLAEIGVDENERNLRNKVSRGKFTAGFLLQVLTAIGVTSLPM